MGTAHSRYPTFFRLPTSRPQFRGTVPRSLWSDFRSGNTKRGPAGQTPSCGSTPAAGLHLCDNMAAPLLVSGRISTGQSSQLELLPFPETQVAFRAGAYSAESCREKWVSLVGRRRGARRLAGRPLSTFPDLRTYVTYS